MEAGPALGRCSCIGPRTMVFGKVVDFCQILLELKNSVETAYNCHCQQTVISFERTMNFSTERYQTRSILILHTA